MMIMVHLTTQKTGMKTMVHLPTQNTEMKITVHLSKEKTEMKIPEYLPTQTDDDGDFEEVDGSTTSDRYGDTVGRLFTRCSLPQNWCPMSEVNVACRRSHYTYLRSLQRLHRGVSPPPPPPPHKKKRCARGSASQYVLGVLFNVSGEKVSITQVMRR